MIRRLLPLVGVLLALTTTAQRADAATGNLTYTAYTWNETPDQGETCSTGTTETLILEWDTAPIDGCPGDYFGVTINGSLYNPNPTTSYAILSDDGIRITIDGQLVVNEWWPRGCSGWVHDLQLSEGWHDIRIDYFEAGGSTCLWIYQVTENGWQPIPSVYLDATSGPAPGTTTTDNATTTTTTEPETSTSSPPTTDATGTTTSGPQTTYQPTESSAIPTSTATIESTIQMSTSTPPLDPPNEIENTSDATTTTQASSTTTISTSSIPPTLSQDISSDAAIALATDPDTVEQLTPEQAAQVFAAIDEGELTPEQAAAIVVAVQNAPDEIRREFEAQVNVFSGAFDNYIPTGSLVPVSTRRIIIVTTGLLVAMPPSRRK